MANKEAQELANILISQAKEWSVLCEKRKNNKSVPILNENGCYEYRPANPGEIAGRIKKTLKELDPKILSSVLSEISKISTEADKGIEKNGGSYLCEAGETKIACNLITSFYEMSKDQDGKTTNK